MQAQSAHEGSAVLVQTFDRCDLAQLYRDRLDPALDGRS